MSTTAVRSAHIHHHAAPNLVFAVLMLGLIGAGVYHSFAIAPLTGAPSLHPLSAFGYAVLAAHFLLRRRVHGWSPHWMALHGLVLFYSLLRIAEAVVPGWAVLMKHPALLDLKAQIGFHGCFSVETALGLAFLHLAFLVKPLGRSVSVVAFLAAASVATLALLKAAFQIVLWGQDISVFSLGCILTATLALAYRLRDMQPIQPFFKRDRQSALLRTMLFASLVIPWVGGYILFRIGDIDYPSHETAGAVFRMIGWVMVLLVIAIGYFMEKSRLHVRQAAELDHLRDIRTGALNHAGLFAASDDMPCPRGVVLFDIDCFERPNTMLGRADGDRLLREVVDAVSGVLEPGEALSRWGGDEFLVALEAPDKAALQETAERIRAAIDGISPRILARRVISVSATFGVAMAGEGRHGIEKAAGDAYVRLYSARAAKQDGDLSDCVAP